MFWRAGKEAVVLMRLSTVDDCELRGGAALVDIHNLNSSVRKRRLDSCISYKMIRRDQEYLGTRFLLFLAAICLPGGREKASMRAEAVRKRHSAVAKHV